MSQQQPSFLVSLAIRASGSAGFARSIFAICTMWLIPELKPAIHYNLRKKTPLRRSKRRSITSTTPSSPASPPSPSPPLQRPILKPSRRSSFAVVLSTITPRKWSSSSTPPSDVTSSSASDSDSSPSFRRPRLPFSPHLPKMKRALSITPCPKSIRQCDPMERSKSTSVMSSEPIKSLKENVIFTHPWRMSRSRTSSIPLSTPSPVRPSIPPSTPSGFIIPKRLPFKRNISFSRPTCSSPLAPPCSPSSYFARNHPRKESYSSYLRALPRFEGAMGKPDITSRRPVNHC